MTSTQQPTASTARARAAVGMNPGGQRPTQERGRRAPRKLVTRRPTGVPSWPMILLAGREKCGKSWGAAQASASPLIDRTFWFPIGEGQEDDYGAIEGARYEIVDYDGSWADLIDNLEAAEREPVPDPSKPHLWVLDSMTNLWQMCVNEQQMIADRRRNGTLTNPAVITMDGWGVAKRRWNSVIDLCRAHKGPVIFTARLEQVVVMADGQPTKEREWRVQAEKNLAYEVSGTVEIRAPRDFKLAGIRSTRLNVPVGGNLDVPDFTVDKLWRDLGLAGVAAQADSYVPPRPEAILTEQESAHDWEAEARAQFSSEALRGVYRACVAAGEMTEDLQTLINTLGATLVADEARAAELDISVEELRAERAATAEPKF